MKLEDNDELYVVSVKGDGISIEKSVPASVARQVINAVMGGSITGASAEPGKREDRPNAFNGARRLSLREFLEETQAKRNPDKITVIAEYLFEFEGQELFARDDIKSRFRLAGEAAPANFPRDFSWTVRNGWIAEDPKSPESFYVTQKGRNAIENKFSSDVKKATSQPSARRRSRRTRTAQETAA